MEIYTSETGAYGVYYRTELVIQVPSDCTLKPLENLRGVYVETGYKPVILPAEVVKSNKLTNSLGWVKE